jgi:hypothetical protein
MGDVPHFFAPSPLPYSRIVWPSTIHYPQNYPSASRRTTHYPTPLRGDYPLFTILL